VRASIALAILNCDDLELVLKDHTGQIRLSRFFAGCQQSRLAGTAKAPIPSWSNGCRVGIGESKYGLTLEDRNWKF